MNYRCQKGCSVVTRSGNRKPMWHARKSECPYEPEYRGPVPASPAGTAAPAAAPAPIISETAPKPAGPKPGVGILSFGARPAETTTRTAPATAQVKPEFEVDSDHALSLFELIDNICVRVIRFGDGLLDAKPFTGHVLLASVADEELVKKKMGRRIATSFTRALGATTQEEAHGIIESGGVLVLIGGGFMAVGSHIVVEWRPAIKRKIDARKAKKPKVEFPAPEGQAPPMLAPGRP
jgi:hypothetical protein